MADKEWVKILRVLANEKRLKIINTLSRSDELPVFEIADRIGLSYKSTSRHLNRLAQLDILDAEGRGRSVEYRLSSTLNSKVKRILKEILS